LELIKDYNLDLRYHPGKANVVVDAPSRKTNYIGRTDELRKEMQAMNLHTIPLGYLTNIHIQPMLETQIKEA